MATWNGTPVYTADNIADVVIDIIVGVGGGLFVFASLIALVFLYNWVSGRL